MAWQNVQQTIRLLSSLQGFGMEQKGWKGGGKGNGKSQVQEKKRWCKWKTCTAAQQGKPTVGGKCNCYSCGRHFSHAPPLEMLVESAYQIRLAELEAKRKGGANDDNSNNSNNNSNKDTAKGKAAGKGGKKGQLSKDDPTDEDLKKVREKRLEELKAAKNGQPSPQLQPSQTILQGQVALAASRQPVLPADTPKEEGKWLPMTVDSNTAAIMVDLQEALEAISSSVALDLSPTSFQPSMEPQEELEKLTAATKSCATAADKTKLEEDIGKTKAMIAMEGPPNVKEMLAATLKTQEADLEKLSKKAHGNAMQKAGLEETKAALVKDREARAERADGGQSRAAERKTERLRLLQQIVDAATEVKRGVLAHDTRYAELHQRRQDARLAHDVEVDKLLDELIAARKADAEAETAQKLATASVAPQTQTSAMEVSPPGKQDALATALEEIKKHKELIAQLQAGVANSAPAAASSESASPAATEAERAVEAANSLKASTGGDNDPLADLWRELAPDVNSLPKPEGAMAASDKKQVDVLSAFFTAVPWGSPLPALTFHVLGAHPSIVHGVIGDKMWQEAWGEKHKRITTTHMVPYSILNVLKLAVERMKILPDADTLADGKARWTAAKEETAKRRQLSTPY